MKFSPAVIVGGAAMVGVAAYMFWPKKEEAPKKKKKRVILEPEGASFPGEPTRTVNPCLTIPDPKARAACLRQQRSKAGQRKTPSSKPEGSRCKAPSNGTYWAVQSGKCSVIWKKELDAIVVEHARTIFEAAGSPQHICEGLVVNEGTSDQYWKGHPDMVALVREALMAMGPGWKRAGDLWPPKPGDTYRAFVTWNHAYAAVMREICGFVPET